MMDRWWVCAVKPGEAKLAHERLAEALQAGGVRHEFWRPVLTVARKARTGAIEHREVPVAPGYLFVRAAATPWVANSTEGLTGLLPSKACPLPVPDDQIAVMREHVRSGDEVIRGRLAAGGFVAGDSLTITDGPFSSFAATVVSVEKHLLTVLAHLFGRPVPVTLRPDQVALASPISGDPWGGSGPDGRATSRNRRFKRRAEAAL